MVRARVPASQAPPAITTGEVLQAARLAFSSPLTRIGPVALRPRLPAGLPLSEHLLTRSFGPRAGSLEQNFCPNATERARRPALSAHCEWVRCDYQLLVKVMPLGSPDGLVAVQVPLPYVVPALPAVVVSLR